jgi:predicted MPP superfamily phosphohydrolase
MLPLARAVTVPARICAQRSHYFGRSCTAKTYRWQFTPHPIDLRNLTVKTRFAILITIVQLILLFGHLFIYETWRYFSPSSRPVTVFVRIAFLLLSISFVPASLLAARYYNRFVRMFYTLASIWLGLLNFLVLAAALCWALYGTIRISGLPVSGSTLFFGLFAGALVVSLYGIINASWVRVKRITVKLPSLPKSWRGRTAALVSDTHLGHVRGYPFISGIVAMLRQVRPDILFIAGDLYDGTRVEPKHLAAPWMNLSPPLGKFFVTGNHEEFSHPSQYADALERSGVRTLLDEKVVVDDLHLIGVTYHTQAAPERLRSFLRNGGSSNGNGTKAASILLAHGPHNLGIAEEMGISLQLSGHTHRGQVFPFTWITSRIFRQYTYGLHSHGALTVYTSSGAGTWGPPMRVGSQPEIVLIRFE